MTRQDPFIYVTVASTGNRSATRHLGTCWHFYDADDTGPSGRVWSKSVVRKATPEEMERRVCQACARDYEKSAAR
jgi:hypothetical protein